MINRISGDGNVPTIPKQASGYDFEPMSDGRFLLDFYGDDGFTFAQVVITRDQLERMCEVIEAVLNYVENHDPPKFNYHDLADGYREEIARRRRQEMGPE